MENASLSGKNSNVIQYGDVILIHAAKNNKIDGKLFYVDRMTPSVMHLIEVPTGDSAVDEDPVQYQIRIQDGGTIQDATIDSIDIVSRSDNLGYVLQNGLAVGKTVLIRFNVPGAEPIKALITGVEKDSITCEDVATKKPVYIDFAYEGLPEFVESVDIQGVQGIQGIQGIQGSPDQGSPGQRSFDPRTPDLGQTSNEDVALDTLCVEGDDAMRRFVSMDEIVEDFDEVYIVQEVAARYNVDTQIQDMLLRQAKTDDFRVHRDIQRFLDLRQATSKFEDNGQISKKRVVSKPVVPNKWIIPVVNAKRVLFDLTEDDVVEEADAVKEGRSHTEPGATWDNYTNNRQEGSNNKYFSMIANIAKPGPYAVESKGAGWQQPVVQPAQTVIISTSTGGTGLESSAYRAPTVRKITGLVARFSNAGVYHSADARAKTPATRVIMPADAMSIRSVIVQPSAVIELSRRFLPSTSLAQRISLNLTGRDVPGFFPPVEAAIGGTVDPEIGLFTRNSKTFHRKREQDRRLAATLGEGEHVFGDKALHFYYKQSPGRYNSDSWDRFMKTITPDAEYFLNQQSLRKTTSMKDAVRLLEPLGIYSDNISYSTYKYIRGFIDRSLHHWHAELKNNVYKMRNILDPPRRYYKEYTPNTMHMLFASNEGSELIHSLEQIYGVKFHTMRVASNARKETEAKSNTELMATMQEADYGAILSVAARFVHLPWTLPDNLYTPPLLDELEDAKTAAKYKKARGVQLELCNKVLAKRYTTEDALLKDNSQEASPNYDPGMDTETNYDDAELLDTDVGKTAATRDEKVEYLTQQLTTKYDLSSEPEKAARMASSIVDRKRPIENGDYAVLELRQVVFKEAENKFKPQKQEIVTERIYKRVQNVWRWQQNMSMDEFATNDALLSKKGDAQAQSELSRRYTVTMEEMKLHLDAEYKELTDALGRRQSLAATQRLKQNDTLYGISLIAAQIASEGDEVRSPYMRLRDEVLAIGDVTVRQQSVLQFYAIACRAAVGKEDIRWTYCKETNVPLLPVSFHELAQCYALGDPVLYNARIGEVCRQYGTIDETGGYWVDQASGLTICAIEQVDESISSSEMFQESASAEVDHARMVDALFQDVVTESSDAEKVALVVLTFLMRQTGVREDHTLRRRFRTYFGKLIENNRVFVERETYERMVEKKRAKLDPGQAVTDPPFDIYRDKVIVSATVAAFFCVVQTSVPGVRRSRTKSGPVECHYSFDGYPLESSNPEEDEGIRYMACILHANKVDQRPWNAILKVSLQGLVNNVKALVKHLLADPVVIDAFEVKRAIHGVGHGHSVGKEAKVDIHKWQHFLPPVVPFTVAHGIQNEENSMAAVIQEHEGQIRSMTSRSGQKRHALLKMQSLLSLFCYGFVEHVNRIVKGKQVRLKTQAQVPFTENACCDEAPGCQKVLEYMGAADANLLKWSKLVKELDARLQQVAQQLRAPLLYYLDKPSFPVPVNLVQSTVLNVKLAYIHYMYDAKMYDDPDFKLIVQVAPPTAEYYKCISQMDKLAYFERENPQLKTPEAAVFRAFMTQVNARNVVPLEHRVGLLDETLFRQSKFRESTQLLYELEDDWQVLDEVKKLFSFMYDAPSVTSSQEVQQQVQQVDVRRLDSMLLVKRKRLQESLQTDYGLSVSASNTWNPNIDPAVVEQYYRIAIYNLLRLYPQTALRTGGSAFSAPRHWGFSGTHNDMLNERADAYAQAFQVDADVRRLLVAFEAGTAPMYEWFQRLPASSMQASTRINLYAYMVAEIYYKYIEHLLSEPSSNNDSLFSDSDDDDDVMVSGRATEEALIERKLQRDTALLSSIKMSRNKEREGRLLGFLKTCAQQEDVRFRQVNVDYAKIIDETRVYADKEKESIKNRFNKMTSEGRQVEKLMKKFKLGKWNVGDEVFKYSKDHFDEEIEDKVLFHLNAEGMDYEAEDGEGDEGDEGEDGEGEEGEDDDDGNDVGHLAEYEGDEEGNADIESDGDDDYE